MCFGEDQMSHDAREFGVDLADLLFMVEGKVRAAHIPLPFNQFCAGIHFVAPVVGA